MFIRNNKNGTIASKKSGQNTIKTYSTIDHKAYVFYKNKTKIGTRQTVEHYVAYGKLISTFYTIVSEELASSSGGVYVKGLGYFSVLKYFGTAKAKMLMNVETGKWERFLNYLSDYFYIAFVPFSKSSARRRLYTMDYSYTPKFKKPIIKSIISGFRWQCNASLFYLNKKQTII